MNNTLQDAIERALAAQQAKPKPTLHFTPNEQLEQVIVSRTTRPEAYAEWERRAGFDERTELAMYVDAKRAAEANTTKEN